MYLNFFDSCRSKTVFDSFALAHRRTVWCSIKKYWQTLLANVRANYWNAKYLNDGCFGSKSEKQTFVVSVERCEWLFHSSSNLLLFDTFVFEPANIYFYGRIALIAFQFKKKPSVTSRSITNFSFY